MESRKFISGAWDKVNKTISRVDQISFWWMGIVIFIVSFAPYPDVRDRYDELHFTDEGTDSERWSDLTTVS